MKKFLTLTVFLTGMFVIAQTPYDLIPDFETTPGGHYATGLGIADINGDGWKDIIVANGNDISRQRLVVYYNNGDGTFPADPSWQSNDIDYHGHLSAGDIDNDGDIDIAVSVYLGSNGWGFPGKAKIYYNTGNALEPVPSFQTQYFYSFSCALGDADADGDLDLAVACAEPYNSIHDHGRIFYNNGGSFNQVADWQSNVQMGAMDVEFGDLDQNGFLDLVFVCENTQNYVFLADNQGYLNEYWDWYSDHPENYMNSVDIGRSRVTGPTCFVSTGNDQLGGDGKIKQFMFTVPVPQTAPPSWESNAVGYGSGILLADINHDEYIDLVYGSWWGPMVILEGCCDEWNTTPVFQTTTTSVVEAILMSDLGKFNYQPRNLTLKSIGERGIIVFDEQNIERINSVSVNDVTLDRSEYCYAELKNWLSFKNNIMPGDVVSIDYEYTLDGDIVISNWDPGKGNFIYYNTMNPVMTEEHGIPNQGLRIVGLSPVPTNGPITLQFISEGRNPVEMRICDLAGKQYHSMLLPPSEGQAARHQIPIDGLASGTYLIHISNGRQSDLTKFVVVK